MALARKNYHHENFLFDLKTSIYLQSTATPFYVVTVCNNSQN